MNKSCLFYLLFTLADMTAFAQCPVTITAGGPVTFCQGDSVTLTASNGPSYTWLWKKNGTTISGATLQTYKAKSSGSYTVQVSGTGGCTSISNTIVVAVTLGTTYITANGFTGIGCLNGNVNLSVNTAGLTYQWKLNGANISGATNQNYTGTQAGTYTCLYSNGSCTVLSNLLPVQNQTTTIQHNGPTIFCVDQCGLTAILNMGTGSPVYQWKNNGINIPGATTWNYTASTSGNYTCEVNDQGFCNSPALSGSQNIQAGVPPQISVTATTGVWPVNLCNGQTIDLQVNDVSTGQVWPGGVVDWQKDGIPVSPFPGGNYLLGVSESGVYNAYINTSCGISFAQTGIPVSSLDPANPPVVNNNGVISNCSSIFLFVDPASISFAPYQWKRNGIDIPGETGPTMYATQTGNYSCLVSNTCTTMVTAPVTATITGPIAQITPQGSTTICSGASVVLNATAAGANGYQWKKNNVNIPGATGSTYAASSAGSYSVNVYSANCGVVSSSPVVITVNPTPSPAISATGPLAFCDGASVLLSTSSGGVSYQWKRNGGLIPGATTTSFTATLQGNYKVVKTNSFGCSGTSAATAVTIYNNPTANITAFGPTSFCAGDSVKLKTPLNSAYSYQWKRNNVNINGATGNKYFAKTAGSYKVKATSSNGCTGFSNIINVSVPCRDGNRIPDDAEPLHFFTYPNPSAGEVTLECMNCDDSAVSINLFDCMGREVNAVPLQVENRKWIMTGLTPGVFHAIIRQHGRVCMVKIIRL